MAGDLPDHALLRGSQLERQDGLHLVTQRIIDGDAAGSKEPRLDLPESLSAGDPLWPIYYGVAVVVASNGPEDP